MPLREPVSRRIVKSPGESLEACLAEGLVVYPCAGTVDGTSGDQILIAPPFVISVEEIDDLAARLDRAIRAVDQNLN